MRDKRKAKNCLISRQQAGYKYRFHVPLILNGIGGILFAPLAQMDKSTRLLIGWPWVRAPHGAYAEVAEWHTHAVQSRNFAGSTPAFCTTALTDGKKNKMQKWRNWHTRMAKNHMGNLAGSIPAFCTAAWLFNNQQ